jgi:hypothetical protein
VTIDISVFVPGRSCAVQTNVFSFCTARDRPGTKTEITIVTINVKVNSEEDTIAAICCTDRFNQFLIKLFSGPQVWLDELFFAPEVVNVSMLD